jgi:chemotaxis signal transduction protein
MSEPFLVPSVLYGQDHVQFLEQLTDEAFWEFAATCARHPSSRQMQTEEYVICRIGGSVECLIALAELHAVVPSPSRFSLLPAAPAWMLGITAWTDKLLAVVDLGAYLTQSSAGLSPYGTMLLVRYEQHLLGLATSITGTLIHLDAARIAQLPEQTDDTFFTPCPGAFKGIYNRDQDEQNNKNSDKGRREEMPLLVLNIPAILADIVKYPTG